MSLRGRDIKERRNKWNYIKLKCFCTAKENISKMKKEPTLWENIFTNDTSDKSLISKLHKELKYNIKAQRDGVTPLARSFSGHSQCCEEEMGPGWCGSVDWVLACEPKGRWFHSQSGHMPGLRARCPVGGAREATTHWCFSSSLSPSLPLSLKINK